MLAHGIFNWGHVLKRTTILADEDLLLEAKYLAEREGKTFTSLVHEALTEYIAAHRPPPRFEFIGTGHSGDPYWAERDEEILAAEIDPIEGWSVGRRRQDVMDDSNGSAGVG